MSAGDYLWYSLSLRISGIGLDLEGISRILALTPTFSVRAGEELGPGRDTVAHRDIWVYDFARKWDKSLHELVLLAQTTLGPKAAFLKQWANQHEAVLWCSYQTNLAQGGFELSPSDLAFLSELGVPFVVSVLSWGEVSS